MLFSTRTTVALSFSAFFGSALAALFTDPSRLPKGKKYDYIVVGSGAGGSVIGNRLSENPGASVLIIEAGGNIDGVEANEIPFFAPNLIGTGTDWNFVTTAQPGLNGRSIGYSRGKAIGGSTSVNFMVYTRGSQDDYDRWAQVTGDSGWSWKSLQPYIKKMESFVPSADHHDTTGQYTPSIHGTSGPLAVSLPGFSLPTDSRVVAATKEVGGIFSYNQDMNSGNPLGVGWTQYTIKDGARASAYTSYIKPALSRSNFDVLLNSQVTKVLQTGTQSGSPVFRGVEFTQSSASHKFTLQASLEVILSAGAVQTPQLLLLSGIGDKDQLSKFGIKTIVNNKAVGQNLQDHVLLSSPYTVNSTDTFDRISQDAAFAGQLVSQWEQSHTGALVLGPANQIGWHRLDKNADIFKKSKDPSAGPTSAHYETIFTDGFVSFSAAAPTTGNYFSLFTNVISPESRGSITLKSANPFDAPLIDPGLLNSDFDIFTMREAIKAATKFMEAKAFDGFVLAPYGDFATALKGSDADIEKYAREQSTTVWHPVGSAAMSSRNSDGVLNSDLTVKGTVGLRVVDASAFPFIPTAHTQVPVYILAERAADLIVKTHQSRSLCKLLPRFCKA